MYSKESEAPVVVDVVEAAAASLINFHLDAMRSLAIIIKNIKGHFHVASKKILRLRSVVVDVF